MARGSCVPEHDLAVRLAAFNRVSTGSVDDAAAAVGRIFCPHELKPVLRPSSDFFALHNCAAFGGFSVNYVAYGGSVSIDPGCLERFFLLQIPLHGAARIETASRDIATAPDVSASLLSPTIPTRMTWQSNCAQIILLVDRRLLEQRAAALSGRPVGTVEFEPIVDLSSPCGRALRSQLLDIVDLAERLGPQRHVSPIAAANLRETLLGGLLHGQYHSASRAIEIFGGRAEIPAAAVAAGARIPVRPRGGAARSCADCRSCRHRNSCFAAWLQAAFRNIDFGDAARHPPRTSQCPVDRRLPRRAHHRYRIRSRIYPSQPNGKRLSRQIRRSAVGDVARDELAAEQC